MPDLGAGKRQSCNKYTGLPQPEDYFLQGKEEEVNWEPCTGRVCVKLSIPHPWGSAASPTQDGTSQVLGEPWPQGRSRRGSRELGDCELDEVAARGPGHCRPLGGALLQPASSNAGGCPSANPVILAAPPWHCGRSGDADPERGVALPWES